MHRPDGLPKTGGRQKGSKNKITAAREQEIAASGLTPVAFYLRLNARSRRLNGQRVEIKFGLTQKQKSHYYQVHNIKTEPDQEGMHVGPECVEKGSTEPTA